MARTAPLLGELRSKGSSFLTFSTTTQDFSYLFSGSTIKLAPSHFALLKLPNWENTTDQSLYLDPAEFTPTNADPNLMFPKVVQNYLENMLQYSEESRVDSTVKNYSEQALWKTLRLLGGLDLEVAGSRVIGGQNRTIYRENTTDPDYEKVVKYIGKINMLNHKKSDDGTEYVEFFAHVPTEAGLQTDILFIPDTKVVHGTGLIPNGGGDQYTSGLDSFAGTEQVEAVYDTIGSEYEVGNDLTDLNLDIEDVLGDVNKQNQGDFDFNAVLVYYTIYDSEDANVSERNAWGLMLLEPFETDVANTGTIQTLTKYQPDSIQSGNALMFNFNLAFGNASDQTTSEYSINTYDTVSMQNYLDAISRLNDISHQYDALTSQFRSYLGKFEAVTQAIGNLERLQASVDQIEALTREVELLKTAQANQAGVRITNEELFALFQQTLNAAQDANNQGTNINILPILSQKAYLPNVIDAGNLIVEYDDVLYKWNLATQKWDVYQIP